jgi:copper(I)-binding protein
VPGQSSSAAYFTIRNTGGPDRLMSVSSRDAGPSLHSTTIDNGVMRMRPLEAIEIPANSKVELKPGGVHLMLMGLKRPLEAGSSVPLDLKFEKSGERHVSIAVRSDTPGAAM